MSKREIVVVGASAAGVSSAMAMRAAGFDGGITVLDSDLHQPYERPPLSKNLLNGGVSALKHLYPEGVYQDNGIELVLGQGVVSLDHERYRVGLAGGDSLPADQVVLATGVAARRLQVPGADLRNVLVLRDAKDANALSSQMANGGPLVIIGGGFIGLELAALARENDVDATVVEVAQLPLMSAGLPIGELTRNLHQERGVRFVLGSSVSSFEGTSSVEAVILDNGTRLPAATVVVGVGVVPRVDLARAAGVEVDAAGVVVDEIGQTNTGWIYAAGDVASQPHPALEARGRIEHWDAAIRHGSAVGATVAGTPTRFDSLPYAWSDQYGITLQLFGRIRRTDRFVIRRGFTSERYVAFWLRDGKIGAAMGLNSSKELAATRRLIESGLIVPDESLSDPDVDLRKLAKELSIARG